MHDKTKLLFFVICGLIFSGMIQAAHAEQLEIPSWIKTNAKWWADGKIGDPDFITGIQYLIQNGIMKIPSTATSETKSGEIPAWIKTNAGWWADGKISNSDFVSGIQYLIKSGIINVSNQPVADLDMSKCDQFTTAAEKRTCQKEIELAHKIKTDIESSTPYVIGPVTFYYTDNKIEKTSQGGTILTIYFVVENTGSSDNIIMSCPVNACNYVLSDGKKEIQYTTNTLVYGSLTLKPDSPTHLEWSFFKGLDYDSAKDYSFKINEPWGSGSIPLEID